MMGMQRTWSEKRLVTRYMYALCILHIAGFIRAIGKRTSHGI